MNLLAFVLAEICVCLAGFGTAALLAPARPVSRTEIAGLSLILGPCVVSLALFVFGRFWRDSILMGVIAFLGLALGVLGVLRWRRAEFLPVRDARCWFAFIPMLAAIGWQAGIHPLAADGLFNFELRAQLAALHGGQIPDAFYSDPSRTWTHPGYPLFLPLNEAWIYLCIGVPHQGLGQLLAVPFAAAAICLLYAGVASLTGETWRGLLAVALLFLLPSATIAPGGAASLWADFPLTVIFLAAVLYLVRFSKDGSSLPLFAFFLAMLPWVKREGIVLAAVLAWAFVWIAWRTGKMKRVPAVLLPLVLVWCGWALFLHTVHASADHDFLPVSFETVAGHLNRLPIILAALRVELLTFNHWSLLWPRWARFASCGFGHWPPGASCRRSSSLCSRFIPASTFSAPGLRSACTW